MEEKIWSTKELENMSQHEKMALFIISSELGFALPPFLDEKLQKPHRLTFYLFVYRVAGHAEHIVDFAGITVCPGQVFFLQPHQVHSFPPKDNTGKWFKMAISEETLTQVRVRFPFLLDPFGRPLIDVNGQDEKRVIACFSALEDVVHQSKDKNQALINSYLHALLTELDILYFKKATGHIHPNDLSVFTRFKLIINENFKSQPSIPQIASELHISPARLYAVVKSVTGGPPKEYLLNRIITEAKRCLFYKELPPKELAYHLGFNEPNYFFRLFKKYTGRSVTQFIRDLEETSFIIQK